VFYKIARFIFFLILYSVTLFVGICAAMSFLFDELNSWQKICVGSGAILHVFMATVVSYLEMD